MDKKHRADAYLYAPAAVLAWLSVSIMLNQTLADRAANLPVIITISAAGVGAFIATALFVNAVLSHREALNQQLISALTGKANADDTTTPPPESGL